MKAARTVSPSPAVTIRRWVTPELWGPTLRNMALSQHIPRPGAIGILLVMLVCSCDRSTPSEKGRTLAKKESTATPVATPLDLDDPEQCAPCHTAVVAEWKTSMHAHAHQSRDPIYAAMRALRMKKEGPALGEKCANCHGPRDPKQSDSAIAIVGVGCASCHLVEDVNREEGRNKGAAALTYSAGKLRGPHDPVNPMAAPHGRGPAAPWLTDGVSVCLVCHDAMKNAEGVATCTTGTEYSQKAEKRPCTGCHMPEVAEPNGPVSSVQKHRSHAFLGPHQLYDDPAQREFMASAIHLDGELDGGELRLTLENQTGHSVPSGFPGRMLLIQARGYDATEKELWSNFRDDPMVEDPQAVLNKVYVDDEGKPVLPPYAKELKRDNRLVPDETRTLKWHVPDAVQHVEVQIFYRLVPPAAVSALGLAGRQVAEARLVEEFRLPRAK